MGKTKQILIIRKDLKMRRGKEISQMAHASLGVFTQKLNGDTIKLSPIELEWLNNSFRKVCVYVNSEQELVDVYVKAKLLGLNCILIEDNGLTEFHGVKTKTCCAIGPDYDEKIDQITAGLPLY